MKVKFTFILALLINIDVLACSCVEVPDLPTSYLRAHTVLVATLEMVDQDKFGQPKFNWQVNEVIKGEKNISPEPMSQGLTSCDPILKDGQEWLLFLEHENKVRLGWCTTNRQIQYLSLNWRSELDENP